MNTYMYNEWILITHLHEVVQDRRPCRKFICGLDSHILRASASCSYDARTAWVLSDCTPGEIYPLLLLIVNLCCTLDPAVQTYCQRVSFILIEQAVVPLDFVHSLRLHVSLVDMVVQGASPRQRHGCAGCFPQTSSFIVPVLFIAFATVWLVLTSCTWPSLVPKVLSGGLNRQFADNELFVRKSL